MLCKNRRCFLAILLVFLVLIICFFMVPLYKAQYLLHNLKEDDVVSIDATFGAYPAYPLEKRDQATLINYIQSIKLSVATSNYKDYDGVRSQMFVLHMKDNSSVGISACSPFFIIDNKGYMSKSDSCKQIDEMFSRYVGIIQANSAPQI